MRERGCRQVCREELPGLFRLGLSAWRHLQGWHSRRSRLEHRGIVKLRLERTSRAVLLLLLVLHCGERARHGVRLRAMRSSALYSGRDCACRAPAGGPAPLLHERLEHVGTRRRRLPRDGHLAQGADERFEVDVRLLLALGVLVRVAGNVGLAGGQGENRAGREAGAADRLGQPMEKSARRKKNSLLEKGRSEAESVALALQPNEPDLAGKGSAKVPRNILSPTYDVLCTRETLFR